MKDPDETYRSGADCAAIVASAVGVEAWLVASVAGMTPDAALRFAAPFVAAISDPVRRALLEEALAAAVSVRTATVHAASAPVPTKTYEDHRADLVRLLNGEALDSRDRDVRAAATAMAVDRDMGEPPESVILYAPITKRLARTVIVWAGTVSRYK